MNQRIKKIYYIIPVIYFAVVGVFFFLQFRKSEAFTETIGGFEISGAYSEAGGGRGGKIKNITVAMGSIGFRFSSEEPLSVAYAGGEEVTLHIEKFLETGPDTFDLQFSGGLRLTFSASSEDTPELVIQPETASKPALKMDRVSVPFSLPAETRVRESEILPIISLTEDNANSVVFFTGGNTMRPGTIHTGPPVFTFTAGPEGSFSRLVFKALGSREIDPLRYWFTGERQLIEEDAFQSAVETYRDAAYSGWKELRFDRTDEMWGLGDGSEAFVEQIFIAAASEALFRKDFEFYQQLVEIAEARGGELSYRATCFTGDLRGGYNNLLEEDEKKLAEISEYLENGDANVFSIDHFLQFILTRAPYSLIQNIYALSEAVRFDELSLSQCVDLLSIYNEAVRLLSPLPAPMERLRGVIDARILPAVIKTEKGFFLPASSPDGNAQSTDLALTIKTGIELRKISEGDYADLYQTLGREMIVSVLNTRDKQGFIPRFGTIEKNRMIPAANEGVFGPETLFPELFSTLYTPRFVPLHRENGPGTWLLTAARVVSTSFSETRISITLQFPENLIHHFYLQGVGGFEGLVLHDLRWPSDPNFEIYSSGWVYDRENRSLKVKLEHRQPEETIILNF